jgi:hypothetical protein
MRFLLVAALACTGCSGHGPTAPSAPAPPAAVPSNPPPDPGSGSTAFLAGMVLESGGACVGGAIIEIVGGQGAGQRTTQTGRCSWWDWEDAFEFKNLTPGSELTLRASAAGYAPMEQTFLPTLTRDSFGRYQAILTLTRVE